MADWVSIRADYVSGGGSFRVLAEKYGVSIDAIKRKAAAEKWSDERTKTAPKIHQKTVQRVVQQKAEQTADRLIRILALGDTLLEKAERAAKELDQHLVTNKNRERTITYGDPNAYGKPTKEVIEDTEIIAIVDAPIDRRGVKQLASALKDLRDIAATPRAEEQSIAKIAEMMARLDKEAGVDGVSEPEAGGVSP